MTIQDSDLIQVQNLTGSKVSYFIPETNNVRHFEGQQLRKDITAGELRMLYATKGGRTLLEDYLGIKNKELAREFNISADVFDHEYSWTQKEVDSVLLTGSLDALKAFLHVRDSRALLSAGAQTCRQQNGTQPRTISGIRHVLNTSQRICVSRNRPGGLVPLQAHGF